MDGLSSCRAAGPRNGGGGPGPRFRGTAAQGRGTRAGTARHRCHRAPCYSPCDTDRRPRGTDRGPTRGARTRTHLTGAGRAAHRRARAATRTSGRAVDHYGAGAASGGAVHRGAATTAAPAFDPRTCCRVGRRAERLEPRLGRRFRRGTKVPAGEERRSTAQAAARRSPMRAPWGLPNRARRAEPGHPAVRCRH